MSEQNTPSQTALLAPTDGAKCHWTLPEEIALLNHLIECHAAAGDGSSFTGTTFAGACPLVNALRKKGALKTAKACHNKFNTFRTIFTIIQAIKSKSGWTWSDETGASITPEMEPQWAAFLKANPKAKPFKNKGWVHLEKMTRLMPSKAKGTHVFCPSQGTTGLYVPEPADATSSANVHEGEESNNGAGDGEEMEGDVEEPSQPSQPMVIPSTPSRASRKRERAVSETPAASTKRVKLNAASAIQGLTQSIDRFGDNMCKVLSGGSENSSPERRKAAMRKAQTELWLPDDDRFILYEIFETNTKAADAYMNIEPDMSPFRHTWVNRRVREARSSDNIF